MLYYCNEKDESEVQDIGSRIYFGIEKSQLSLAISLSVNVRREFYGKNYYIIL